MISSGVSIVFLKLIFWAVSGRLATSSGMSGIWEILPKSQENVRKINEFLVMSGKCQKFSMMYQVEMFNVKK